MSIKVTIDNALDILGNGGNIIKTRDDRELILIDNSEKVQNTDDCTWLSENSENGKAVKHIFRTRIEPWLTSLFQSEHLSLLCGSGITRSISLLAHDTDGKNMENLLWIIKLQ